MFWLIISIIVVLGLFVVLGCDLDEEKWSLRPRQIVCLIGLLLILPGCITKIPANSVGIVYSPFGK